MPFRNQVHIDVLLANVSVKYSNKNYIAEQVFPRVPVKKDSDLYRTWVRNFRIPETRRADRARSREYYFEVSTGNYALERHALSAMIGDREAANYDIADLRADTTEALTDALDRRRELNVATLFTTTNWSLNVSLAATAAFSANTTVSNPIPIFDTAATTIIANGGGGGDMIKFGILPRNGFVSCKNHVSVLDRTKYTSAEMTLSMLQALFDLPQLLVPQARPGTAALGIADVIANIWGDNAFVGYKPSSPGPLKASAGYMFGYERPLVKRWREEAHASECVEVEREEVPKVVASLSGYLIRDID